MKVYISADIEGITGVTHWDEATPSKPDYMAFQKQMTAEVAAACEGANAAGATEIWVKDAHEGGRNIDPHTLPENTRLIRGWSGHPLSMVQELDESFHALMMIGYHARAGSGGNPLSHTMASSRIHYITINGIKASEFLLFGYAGWNMGVPVVFLSGDEDICANAKKINPNMGTVAVKKGVGDSTVSIHPEEAVKQIRAMSEKILRQDPKRFAIHLPDEYVVEIGYKSHQRAYMNSFFPGMEMVDDVTLRFRSKDYFEVLRMALFAL